MLLKIRYNLLFTRRWRHLRHANRNYSSDKKIESYFSAIGGETDEPPPDLTPQQVNTILRTNERTIFNSLDSIKLIECNQLASNYPIEDRLRVSRFNLNSHHLSDSLALAVFDGHGGGSCADVVSRRLFHYIALSLIPNIKKCDTKTIESYVSDLCVSPNQNHNINSLYNDKAADLLEKHLLECEQKALEKFIREMTPTDDIWQKLKNCFTACDNDVSNEIEYNLLSNSSNNILLHFYSSLAVSGCCVSLLLIHQNRAYIANSGDCRTVMGLNSKPSGIKTIELSKDHNSDNLNELKRILSEHPKSEQNNVIKNDRLLGQLMPLRAMGDYNYKWSIEKMQKLGLTRAFGSHVIPPYYLTPPYLISMPQIEEISLEKSDNETDRYIILATDGLWEQFESTRKVVKSVNRFKEGLKKRDQNNETADLKFDETQTLGEINDLLKSRAKPQTTSFENISVEDHLIVDTNCATHLIRTALGDHPSNDPHLDQQHMQHSRIVTYLTLPQSVVRNFRDDISLIVIEMS